MLLLHLSGYGQKTDYTEYHKGINKAEELFFMQNKGDSSLLYYDKVFSEYNFIFVKDLVNAAQISIFLNRPFKKYIERGFEQGLKLSHLKAYPLFAKEYPNLIKDKKLESVHRLNRQRYLSRIDFKYLDWIYKTAIKDQQDKNLRNKYNSQILKVTDRLIDSIRKKGFPGDRIIGIADSTIFKEIGKSHLDLYEQRKKHKGLWYMTADEDILSQQWPLILLVHNPCSFHLYKDILINEMKKGNIHPREIGLIYDNMYRFKGEFASYCNNVSLKGVYRLNMFTEYENYNDIKQTDKMREELFIVPVAVDERKRDYESQYGFRLFSGFWGCR